MTQLLELQRQLQADANDVVRQLRLDELLGSLGQPVRVGSSAMGLMVRRDIDITVVCPRLDVRTLEELGRIAAGLMQLTTSVMSVRFRNDCGDWNSEPEKYPDGLYLGLTVRAESGAMWTLDIWAVDQAERQPDLAHLKTLLPRIADEHRKAIIQIKQVLAGRPKSEDSVPSALVYEAVLDHEIRTVEQFDAWRGERLV